MYLGILWGSGIFALLAFLLIVSGYILISVKRIFTKSSMGDEQKILSTAITIAVIAYVIQGIFNDSVIGNAIIFWILLGMGISINSNINENKKTNMES
jgi:hypothetical protein